MTNTKQNKKYFFWFQFDFHRYRNNDLDICLISYQPDMRLREVLAILQHKILNGSLANKKNYIYLKTVINNYNYGSFLKQNKWSDRSMEV